jgi:hypothetical protein
VEVVITAERKDGTTGRVDNRNISGRVFGDLGAAVKVIGPE